MNFPTPAGNFLSLPLTPFSIVSTSDAAGVCSRWARTCFGQRLFGWMNAAVPMPCWADDHARRQHPVIRMSVQNAPLYPLDF